MFTSEADGPRIRGEGSTDDSQLSELEEADTRDVIDVPRQRRLTVDEDSQISGHSQRGWR